MIPSSGIRLYHKRVISCEEAADARQINLHQELKTLLLKVGHRRIAMHLQGSDRLYSKRLKHLLHVREIRFMRESELVALGLQRGAINPWNLPPHTLHLLCIRTFQNRIMGTNTGSLFEGLLFSPTELLSLPNLVIGEFGCP